MKPKTRYKLSRLMTFFAGLLAFVIGIRWLLTIADNVTTSIGVVAVAAGYFIVTILGAVLMYKGLRMKYTQ